MTDDAVHRIIDDRIVDHIVDGLLADVVDHIVAVVQSIVAVLQNQIRVVAVRNALS